MNYKSFNLGDWIGHISGEIEDETTLDGNEMRDLVEFLSGLPKWIPVSERLPEDEVEVLIYTTDKKINKAYRRIQSWTIDRMEWLVFETLGYSYTYKDDKVLAWMPLPEPYKEESEGVCI